MKKQILVTSIVLTTALIWGCDKGPSSTQEVSDNSTTEAAKEVSDNSTTEAVKEMTDSAKDMTSSAVTAVKEESAELAESASEMAATAVQEAEQLIGQATQYINEGNLDLAETIMTQLASLRDSLPESIQTQIDNLQSLFTAKQTAEDATKSVDAAQSLIPGQN